MTYAPGPLVALGRYLVAHGAVNLGVVGDTAHQAKGVSYHLGADKLAVTAYSTRLPRDKAGLSNAASAIDIGRVGGSLAGLRDLSKWLVAECQRGACPDIREVIFSPDGKTVWRWDSVGNALRTGAGQGDKSHLTHTHVSFYRDSERRAKLAYVEGYFAALAPPPEDDMAVTAQVTERWHPTLGAVGQSNGVLRASMDRSAPIVKRIPADESIVTVAEFGSGASSWRLVKTTDRSVLYALRSDWISDGREP